MSFCWLSVGVSVKMKPNFNRRICAYSSLSDDISKGPDKHLGLMNSWESWEKSKGFWELTTMGRFIELVHNSRSTQEFSLLWAGLGSSCLPTQGKLGWARRLGVACHVPFSSFITVAVSLRLALQMPGFSLLSKWIWLESSSPNHMKIFQMGTCCYLLLMWDKNFLNWTSALNNLLLSR